MLAVNLTGLTQETAFFISSCDAMPCQYSDRYVLIVLNQINVVVHVTAVQSPQSIPNNLEILKQITCQTVVKLYLIVVFCNTLQQVYMCWTYNIALHIEGTTMQLPLNVEWALS